MTRNPEETKTTEETQSASGQNLPAKRERILSPSVNVYENEKEARFVFDMPGVQEQSLEIGIDKGILSVEGRVDLPIPTGFQKEFREQETDLYRRRFHLNKPIDAEKAQAVYTKGQLVLTLPKSEPQKKKINIQMT